MASWSEEMSSALSDTLLQSTTKGDGLFFPACLIHTLFNDIQPIIKRGGKSFNYLQASYLWVQDWINYGSGSKIDMSKHLYVDDCGAPMCNPSCDFDGKEKEIEPKEPTTLRGIFLEIYVPYSNLKKPFFFC